MQDSKRLNCLLQSLQDATSCEGFEALAQHSRLRNRRTLYRWRRSFGARLRVIPSFSLERLGLEHLHLVIANPDRLWLRFPYAVEHAWLTNDFLSRCLYLHCIVPSTHKGLLRSLLRDCQAQGWCSQITVLWSGSGWQEIVGASSGSAPFDVPLADDVRLLRSCPFVVPAIFESWDHAGSFAGIWRGVTLHAEDRLRSYLPRGKIYHVNGGMHVRDAFETLSKEGLFRQYLVRYDGWHRDAIEAFIFINHAGDWVAELCEALRPDSIALENYSGNGTAFLRVIGREGVLRQLLGLQEELLQHGASVFLRNTRCAMEEHVRFCYELLYDPKSGEWVFPHHAIMAHLGERL